MSMNMNMDIKRDIDTVVDGEKDNELDIQNKVKNKTNKNGGFTSCKRECIKDNLYKLDTNQNKKFDTSKWMNMARGLVISSIHGIMVFYLITVTIFSFNVKLLLFSLLVNFGLIIINILVHNCPLTLMEEEILGDSIINWFNRHMPINYGCKRQFEVQLQYLFVSSGIITIKILFYFMKDDLKNYLNIIYT